MKRVAVIGAGAFGRNHLRVVKESARVNLSGVLDIDVARSTAAARDFQCTAFQSLEELAADSDAAVVAATTGAHADIGCRLLEAGIDVLMEKPIAEDGAGARRLIAAAGSARILQIGHLERFNPAILALHGRVTTPLFFEIHRMSPFSPRSLDVDVVLDLMVHDIDLVLHFTRQQPSEIRAAGISVLSSTVDIANVRIAFPNGCVTNLTASRVSTERIRKMRLFQPRQYISVDYARQDGVIFSVSDAGQIGFQPLPVEKVEPLKAQFDAFVDSIETRQPPACGAVEGARALEVALDILDKIEEHSAIVARSLGVN
ncbi:MAG: Gfo/Idh/MocA family oxidoreductase [Candidatus Solibacter usitatus]|nr:Gfo/Idh/MocA family oxidoreductase [Candidatus Solibacter usitatus]